MLRKWKNKESAQQTIVKHNGIRQYNGDTVRVADDRMADGMSHIIHIGQFGIRTLVEHRLRIPLEKTLEYTMVKEFQLVLDDAKDWHDITVSGAYIIKQTHLGDIVSLTESTIKNRELPERAQKLIAELVDLFKCLKMEIVCDTSGKPDRVVVCRVRL